MAKQHIGVRLHPEFVEAARALAGIGGKSLTDFVTDAVCTAIAQAPDLPAEHRTELLERAMQRFHARMLLEGYPGAGGNELVED